MLELTSSSTPSAWEPPRQELEHRLVGSRPRARRSPPTPLEGTHGCRLDRNREEPWKGEVGVNNQRRSRWSSTSPALPLIPLPLRFNRSTGSFFRDEKCQPQSNPLLTPRPPSTRLQPATRDTMQHLSRPAGQARTTLRKETTNSVIRYATCCAWLARETELARVPVLSRCSGMPKASVSSSRQCSRGRIPGTGR